MTIIVFSFLLFLSLLEWIVLFDVILSWTTLLGIRWRPRFIQAIVIPLYGYVRRFIPTAFGGIDFAPIVIFLAIELLTKFLIFLDPNVVGYFL